MLLANAAQYTLATSYRDLSQQRGNRGHFVGCMYLTFCNLRFRDNCIGNAHVQNMVPNFGDQCATPAATLSSMNRPSRNRSSPKASASGPGSPFAMSSAMAQPEPGMALKPPVPQPQLMKQLARGV